MAARISGPGSRRSPANIGRGRRDRRGHELVDTAHDHRIALEGTPAEPVDAKAKDSATKRLAHLAARHEAGRGRQGETEAYAAN